MFQISLRAYLLVFWAAIFISLPSFAQNSLSGKVTDEADHSALVGATVYIPDLKRGATSNTDGSFIINDLPQGTFLIDVRFIGYANFIGPIQIAGPIIHDFGLEKSVTELNEIVVTGMSHSSELRSNPLPIVTVNAASLDENSATNLIDNVSKKPGVNQITTGPAISKPMIRGLGYNRIISLYDGIRQEGQQWGDEHGIEIDEYSVDRVEIIKGAGSLMYGSDGIGGVLNFLTPNPVAEGAILAKYLANFQTNNGLIGNSLMLTGNRKGFYWLARASKKDAMSYSNRYDGRVFNSGFQEADFNGHVGLSKAWGYSQLNASSFHQHLGLVEGDRDSLGHFTRLESINGNPTEVTASHKDLTTYQLFVPKQEIQHLRISNSTNLYLGASRLQINAGYQRNQRKEYGEVADDHLRSLYFDLKTINYNLTYFLPEFSGWQLSLGTSGMSQHNSNKGIEFLIPEYKSSDWGSFAFVKRHLNRLEIAGGVRLDQRSISIDPLYLDSTGKPTTPDNGEQKFKAGSLRFSNYSASLGFTYPVTRQVTAKLNGSRGFRAPSIAELASNGRHEGSLRYEYGNYNLSPETSLQLDAGVQFNSQHVTAEFSVFQNDIAHYVYAEKLLAGNGRDSIPDPSEPVPAYQYVQGRAQLRGGEFLLDIHPHPLDWLHFENGFSFVTAVNRSGTSDSARYLPFIPPPRFQSEVRANLKKGKLFNSLFVKVEFNHMWAQDHVDLENHTETRTGGYSLWNAGMGGDIAGRSGTTIFSIYLTANNLFDVAYQNHLSRLKYAATNDATGRTGVYNMGRNFSIKIVVPITLRKAG